MTSNKFDDESDLQAYFAELRRQDALQAPEFSALLHRQAAGRKLPLRKLAAAAICMVMVALLVARFRPRPAVPPVPSLTEWKSPTDFLLQTPGRGFLQNVPQFGAWPEGARVPSGPPSPAARKTI